MKNITQALKVVTLALILSFGISYVYAWTAPTVTPPGGNVSAPINTSATTQYKEGIFGVGGLIRGYSNAIFDGNVGIGTTAPGVKLDVNGIIKATGLQITDGAGSGKLLTSDASGNATWQTGTTATLPIKVRDTACNSTTDSAAITSDRTMLLTCQANIWSSNLSQDNLTSDGTVQGATITSSGRVSGNTLRPTLVATEGASCATYQTGDTANSATGLILSCQSGVWKKQSAGAAILSKLAPAQYVGRTATGVLSSAWPSAQFWFIEYNESLGGYILRGSNDAETYYNHCSYPPYILDARLTCYDGNGRTYYVTPAGIYANSGIAGQYFTMATWN